MVVEAGTLVGVNRRSWVDYPYSALAARSPIEKLPICNLRSMRASSVFNGIPSYRMPQFNFIA